MDSQAKQEATHKAHTKFREFYPGDRVLVKDLRKEHTWWPSSIAGQSEPKSYQVLLNDSRVWKRHVDHIGRDTMDSSVSTGIDKESGNTFPDPVQQCTFGACIPLPEKLPMNTTFMQPVDSETLVQLENESMSQLAKEESSSAESSWPKVKQVSLRRSGKCARRRADW